MNPTSDMMDDLNKYAAIWDKAVANGVFDDASKPVAKRTSDSSGFFGNSISDDYDMDGPINE